LPRRAAAFELEGEKARRFKNRKQRAEKELIIFPSSMKEKTHLVKRCPGWKRESEREGGRCFGNIEGGQKKNSVVQKGLRTEKGRDQALHEGIH